MSQKSHFFKKKIDQISLKDLATFLNVRVCGRDGNLFDKPCILQDVASLRQADKHALVYYNHALHRGALEETQAGACLMKEEDIASVKRDDLALLITLQPAQMFFQALDLFYDKDLTHVYSGGHFGSEDGFDVKNDNRYIHQTAFVHPLAVLGENVVVEAFAYIGPHCRLGDGTIISAHSVVGAKCLIGHNVFIGPHVSLACCVLGNNVIIHAGARIGQDGFGYEGGKKIPHIGLVVIEDDVEIGANTTIDRAVIDQTQIGKGTKIDNLVQVGHNVTIGSNCFIAGQVGISGSVDIGDSVFLAGRVGIKDHITIGSGVKVGAGSGVIHNIPKGETWLGGIPAWPRSDYLRKVSCLLRLIEHDQNPSPVPSVE